MLRRFAFQLCMAFAAVGALHIGTLSIFQQVVTAVAACGAASLLWHHIERNKA